jgi:RHS repeat-associated protein
MSYDLVGRVHSVSNPYYAGDTVYATSTTYDALGRPLVVTMPDNNTATTSYTGPTTDSWDEAGAHMQHTTDALGRLVKVMELGTATDPRSLETDYTYDPLDNLTNVNQLGASGETPRTRSFTYDSLARLITSQNPETGTICYGTWSGGGGCTGGYDANSNLLAKTDANGVTMSYGYDALNRLLAKSSSDGTINDAYTYDWSGGTNEIGRLGIADHSLVAGNAFYYDAMGRVSGTAYYAPGHPLIWAAGPSATYDLTGNPISITYADGRVLTQGYDAAGRLTNVTDATSGGPGTVYFSNAQYTAAGALASATYGNGVTESIQYNSRLQPCHTMANSPALPPLLFAGGSGSGGNVYDREAFYSSGHALGGGISGPFGGFYGPTNCGSEQGNSGNVQSIVDNVNVGWTQSFAYDGLNRLYTAARSDGGYYHTYNYDSFGNLLIQDNLNPGPTYSVNPATNQLNRLANNVNIYDYDAAGNLISSGTSDIGGHSFTYNALSQITAVDGGATGSYVYNGSDERAYKSTSSGWTDYVYFNSQPVSEQDNTGTWSDYIYAEEQKIAMVRSAKPIIHIHGVQTQGAYGVCGTPWNVFGQPNQIWPYVVQQGDTLSFDHKAVSAVSGVWLGFASGIGYTTDVSDMSPDGNWHNTSLDLSPWAGQTAVVLVVGPGNPDTPVGPYDAWLENIMIRSPGGTVHQLFAGGAATGSVWGTCGNSDLSLNVESTPVGTVEGTTYYLDDHLGTAQVELSSAGWPLWQGQFTPFGAELPDGSTTMHYKFTGKERDSESGLDFFGARYYASTVGRWMSPDWAAKPEAVPYSSLGDPQSLNLYQYVGNNPLSKADADGHCLEDVCVVEGVVAVAFVATAITIYAEQPAQQRSMRQP